MQYNPTYCNLRYMCYCIRIMKKYLTNKQKIVWAAINDFIKKSGKSPTLEEIRKALGYAGVSSVQRHVDALVKKGYVTREEHQPRSLELTIRNDRSVEIPLLGNIACGEPFFGEQNIQEWVSYDATKLRGDAKEYFFLTAVGDSMNKAGIDNGDLVLIKRQQAADFGSRVAVLLGDEVTIKKLMRGDGYYILQPESTKSENKPTRVYENPFKMLSIQGIVVDVKKKGSV